MDIKKFFGELFRNKVFIIAYIIFMVIVAIIIGYQYGGDGVTTYHCFDASHQEITCPAGTVMNQSSPVTGINVSWDKQKAVSE